MKITIKHYALNKKSDREDFLDHLMHRLEKGKGLAKVNAKKTKGSQSADERIQIG